MAGGGEIGDAAVEVQAGEVLVGGEAGDCAGVDDDGDVGGAGGRVGIDRVLTAGEMDGVIATAAAGELEGLDVGGGD